MSDKSKDTKEKYDVPLDDHEYDGIQEFNNPAPFWWQLFFYLSIAFAFGYYAYHELGNAPSLDQELAENITAIRKIQKQNEPTGPDEKQLLALTTDSNALKTGKEAFTTKCAACHAADGGGLIGPNLTDRFWIHGKGSLGDIYGVVYNGVLDKGMPAWGSLLTHDELYGVVAYVKTLSGKTTANPKAPQGNEVKE